MSAFLYILARLLSDWLLQKADDSLSLLGDATSFSGGVLLLLGVSFQETVLKAIGDTTPFLVFAGGSSVYYAIRALFQRKP